MLFLEVQVCIDMSEQIQCFYCFYFFCLVLGSDWIVFLFSGFLGIYDVRYFIILFVNDVKVVMILFFVGVVYKQYRRIKFFQVWQCVYLKQNICYVMLDSMIF